MFPESLLEYATAIDSILRDWSGFVLQPEDEHHEQLPAPIIDCALMLVDAGWDRRTDPSVVVDAILDLLNSYDLDEAS